MIFSTLLNLHIVGGSIALLAGYTALMVKRGSPRHRMLGRFYVGGMLGVAVTGFPMSILHPNPFLFGVMIFSGYFVLTGWLAARYRNGEALSIERGAAALLLFFAFPAAGYMIFGSGADATFKVIGLVFAGIGAATGGRDLLQLRHGPLEAQDRIIKHLVSMCAALIATTTAFVVTAIGHVAHVPPLALWLGPTIVLTPVIFYWAGRLRQGMFRY